jgi:hypothetical protein
LTPAAHRLRRLLGFAVTAVAGAALVTDCSADSEGSAQLQVFAPTMLKRLTRKAAMENSRDCAVVGIIVRLRWR